MSVTNSLSLHGLLAITTVALLPTSSFGFIHSGSGIINNKQRKVNTSSRLHVGKRRFAERSARQEERIYELQRLSTRRTSDQESELKGLMNKSFVEQYDPSSFSESHASFKQAHNQVFAALCCYCGCHTDSSRNAFFLDGQNAGTASALTSKGLIPIESCYVANRHETTCKALKEWGLQHVAHASAQESLSDGGIFHSTSFGAYYFDACGGHPPIILGMLKAALDKRRTLEAPVAIGFSIVGGNRDVVNKEMEIIKSLVKLAKARGLRVDHVMDDCERYGISDNKKLSKVEGNTMTSWFLLENDIR